MIRTPLGMSAIAASRELTIFDFILRSETTGLKLPIDCSRPAANPQPRGMRLTHPICIQGAKKEGRKSLPAHASLQQYKQHLTWLIVVPLIASGTAQIGAGGKYCLVAS